MRKLLYDLDFCDFPFTCPHGRPTMIKITWRDFEKKFKRED
jgi:DNA mismatch repair protein MutL